MFLSCQFTEKYQIKDLWLLDNGCNNHMIGNKELFSSIDISIKSKINLRDNYQVKALCKGVVSVLTKQYEKKCIPHVF
jgi:hypothetical protein